MSSREKNADYLNIYLEAKGGSGLTIGDDGAHTHR